MTKPSVSEIKLSKVFSEIMTQKNLSLRDVAEKCDVTYQTVKNLADGGSPNAKFFSTLVEELQLLDEPQVLRNLLLGFLHVQFSEREAARLLQAAGFVE